MLNIKKLVSSTALSLSLLSTYASTTHLNQTPNYLIQPFISVNMWEKHNGLFLALQPYVISEMQKLKEDQYDSMAVNAVINDIVNEDGINNAITRKKLDIQVVKSALTKFARSLLNGDSAMDIDNTDESTEYSEETEEDDTINENLITTASGVRIDVTHLNDRERHLARLLATDMSRNDVATSYQATFNTRSPNTVFGYISPLYKKVPQLQEYRNELNQARRVTKKKNSTGGPA